MNNLEKYLDQVIEQKPVVFESAAPSLQASKSNIGPALLRRWYIVLLATVVLGAVTLPAVWLLVEPKYVVTGAMNVSPVVRDVLTGKADYGDVGSYREFVNTHVAMLTSGPTLQKIADDLAGRNLAFFSSAPQTRLDRIKVMLGIPRGSPDPVTKLKDAIAGGIIAAGPVPATYLVGVTMKSPNAAEARQIVDSFLLNYESMYGSASLQQENADLQALEKNKTDLINKIRDLYDQQKNLTAAYGTPELTERQRMELEVQSRLQGERTSLEVRKIALESSISLLEQTKKVAMSPEQVLSATREYVNSDPTVKDLSAQIVEMEKNLTIARVNIAPGNPELKKQETLLATFKKTMDDRKKELDKEFSDSLGRRLEDAAAQQLKQAQTEYQQTLVHLQKIEERLSAQEIKTQKIRQDSVDIQDIQFNLNLNNQLYEDVSRRLKLLQMEQQQRPRISLAHAAEIEKVEDKRIKYMAALGMMALVGGCILAVLRDKADKTLQNPDDVSRQIGLPLLGTTTSSRTVRPELFAEQIAGDYQTIRTNLGLATSGGMPRRLAVSSAGTREGKTTFAVNLATSLAKAGKKVLLIDGDLRKPDVRYMLNLPNGTAGVQEVLLGEDPSQIIRTVPGSGLHVLVANSRNLADVYELLTAPSAAEQIERLGREYDHLIVDTPPALAFPDALVWAKLTDAVILVGFAGQTTSTDLKEAKERFTRIRVKVLGAILSNVRAEQSLYRYNYGYASRGATTMRKARKHRRLLLPAQAGQDKTTPKDA